MKRLPLYLIVSWAQLGVAQMSHVTVRPLSLAECVRTAVEHNFDVLQLQRDLTSARSEEIRALAEYNRALALLALREGSVLQRHKLELEVK